MRLTGVMMFSCLLVFAGRWAARGDTINEIPPRVDEGNTYYVGNRPPLMPSRLLKLPVGAIRPRGWVRRQLELQADGYTGRLTEISEFLKKENNAWLSPAGQGERGWEEVPGRGFPRSP